MTPSPHLQRTLMIAALLTLAESHFAQASQQLAADKGCYNCHGANPRGDAPAFDRLSSRLSHLKGDAAAEQKFVAELQSGEPLQHIGSHEHLTPESAKALVHWLVEGAK